MKSCIGWLAGLVGLVVALACVAPTYAAALAPPLNTPSGLAIAEIKITGDELLVLENNTSAPITDLSSYRLYEFNKTDPLAAGSKSSSQQLPAATLDPGQTLILSSEPRATCGAEIAGKLSVNLTDSGGFVELVRLSQDSKTHQLTQTAGDSVSWNKSASGIIQNIPSSSSDPLAAYYRIEPTDDNPSGWQMADIDTPKVCQLQVTQTAPAAPLPPVNSGGLLAAPTSQPPATIISLKTVKAKASEKLPPSLPPADIGLASPQISELLPNPNGTGTDATKEFIELYNSNNKTFDLSGFTLETGSTTKHKYVFPNGTKLAAKSFKAFYSRQTGLALSNSGGQSDLLDPFGKALSQTAEYGSAKDGKAWALAKGKWYWTTSPTPGASNKIQQDGSTSAVLGAKTKKSSASSNKSSTSKAAPIGASSSTKAGLQVTPIHPWALAVVAALALAYGLYEYRLDLANRIHQLRTNHKSSR